MSASRIADITSLRSLIRKQADVLVGNEETGALIHLVAPPAAAAKELRDRVLAIATRAGAGGAPDVVETVGWVFDFDADVVLLCLKHDFPNASHEDAAGLLRTAGGRDSTLAKDAAALCGLDALKEMADNIFAAGIGSVAGSVSETPAEVAAKKLSAPPAGPRLPS